MHVLATSTLARMADAHPDGEWDPRRMRPNILIDDSAEPGNEDDWLGCDVHIGEQVVVHIVGPTPRCVMTTLAQPGLAKDSDVLKTVARVNMKEMGALGQFPCAGSYAEVVCRRGASRRPFVSSGRAAQGRPRRDHRHDDRRAVAGNTGDEPSWNRRRADGRTRRATRRHPVVMVNLLKFRATADVRATRATRRGRATPAEVGGTVATRAARRRRSSATAKPWWDAILVVEYPSPAAFIDMVTNEDYLKVHEHRRRTRSRRPDRHVDMDDGRLAVYLITGAGGASAVSAAGGRAAPR